MKINEYAAAFEAILFASGEPVEIDRFCEVFEIDAETAENIMKVLSDRLCERDSGLRLLKLEKSYQLCSNKEYAEYVRKLLDMRRKAPLSQAAFEVLAVIAYNQPVTKALVEQVRGVDCSGVVSTLVEKGLLEEKGRLELPGRPLLYGTTDNFLRCFSISSLSELPVLPEDDTESGGNQLYLFSEAGKINTEGEADNSESTENTDNTENADKTENRDNTENSDNAEI